MTDQVFNDSEYRQLLGSGWSVITVDIERCVPVLVSYNIDPEDTSVVLLNIKLGKRDLRLSYMMPFQVPDISSMTALVKSTAEEPGSGVGIVKDTTRDNNLLRLASICGYGYGCSPGYGFGNEIKSNLKLKCVGLDIEQTTHVRDGRFPLAIDPLVSVALWTSDGRGYCRYTCGYVDEARMQRFKDCDVARVDSSRQLVIWLIQWLEIERPDFILIHNGYVFDIQRLCAHAPPSYHRYFEIMNLGMKGRGMNLRIAGCVVIDTLWFLNKVHRSDYESLSLDEIARTHGLAGKSKQPSLNIDTTTDCNVTEIVLYNMFDAYLHLKVAIESGCIDEICSLSQYLKCPLIDSTRYITGTMAACAMSSYALASNRVLDWSPEADITKRVLGALVVEPTRGYHSDVICLDFSSMYPSVMIAANISGETVHAIDRKQSAIILKHASGNNDLNVEATNSMLEADSVTWGDGFVIICVQGELAYIDTSKHSITREILQNLIKLRREVGKSSKAGWAFKVAANSVYGSISSPTSGLFNYLAGSAVTLISRWLLSLLIGISRVLGFEVVYGDTDSVFLSNSLHKCLFEDVQSIFSTVLQFTPFGEIVIECDKYLKHLLLFNKKMYFGVQDASFKPFSREQLETPVANYQRAIQVATSRRSRENATRMLNIAIKTGDPGIKIVTKGIASVRKDRVPIVREVTTEVCRILCTTGAARTAADQIREVLSMVRFGLKCGSISNERLIKERRKGGVTYIEYEDVNKIAYNTMSQQDEAGGTFEADYAEPNEFATSSLDEVLNVGNWRTEYGASATMDSLLIARIGVEEYCASANVDRDRRRIDIPPESMFHDTGRSIYIPKRFPPAHAYPVHVTDNVLEPRYDVPASIVSSRLRVNHVLSTIDAGDHKWTDPNLTLVSLNIVLGIDHIRRYYCSRTDIAAPLHVFDSTCVHEIRKSKVQYASRELFSSISDNSRHFGMYGVLHDNTLVDCNLEMDIETKRQSKNTTDADVEDPRLRVIRHHNKVYNGFLCSASTVSSIDAGNTRFFTRDCRIRYCTQQLRDRALDLSDIMYSSDDYLLSYCAKNGISRDESEGLMQKLRSAIRDLMPEYLNSKLTLQYYVQRQRDSIDPGLRTSTHK
ncbi:hypothetical protein HDV05_004414 [Chytridiales sp. JEL 0842]|nr:hypothetical protein HDV05_004414 [Chytridiales sp. JEL 0842]